MLRVPVQLALNRAQNFALEPQGVDIAIRDIATGEVPTVDYAIADGPTC